MLPRLSYWRSNVHKNVDTAYSHIGLIVNASGKKAKFM